tara:strand:+ start:2810 stop:3772 length:963 start_codon:yes stop_codon:yes gene_type:complete
MSDKQPSEWQKSITGDWHGFPAVYAPDGTHVGVNKVTRSSVFEDGKTTYWMKTDFDAVGQLANRFECGEFGFGVLDSDQNRIYTGPDLIGSGRPFGPLVDSKYFSPGWNTDLRTINHVIEERGVQVYSSQLFEADTLVAVFNGLYVRTHDHDTNPETQKTVAEFLENEKKIGKKPFLLPQKQSGTWTGNMDVYNVQQEKVGVNQVTIKYTPITLLRARMDVTIEGVINRQFSYERSRYENHHQYHGPDVFGNAIAYGRYLFGIQHFYGEAMKFWSRDVMLDANNTLCSMWQFYNSQQEEYTTFGVLDWTPGDFVLKAQYL